MSDFYYYNANPNGERTEDCVTRAINVASGLPYNTVSRLLDLVAEHTGQNRISMSSYRYLLEYIFGYPVFYAEPYETVDDIIARYPYNTLLIRISGHLLCVVAGLIIDEFDTGYRDDTTCYWIAK